MVAAVSFMFARTRLRVGLASTAKRSLLELFCSQVQWARSIMSLTRLGSTVSKRGKKDCRPVLSPYNLVKSKG